MFDENQTELKMDTKTFSERLNKLVDDEPLSCNSERQILVEGLTLSQSANLSEYCGLDHIVRSRLQLFCHCSKSPQQRHSQNWLALSEL